MRMVGDVLSDLQNSLRIRKELVLLDVLHFWTALQGSQAHTITNVNSLSLDKSQSPSLIHKALQMAEKIPAAINALNPQNMLQPRSCLDFANQCN